MKLTQTLLCAAIAGAMAFAAGKASSAPAQYLPLPKVSISGTITYTTAITTNGAVVKGTLKTVSFTTKSLIDLLNASPTFKSALTNEFSSISSNQVPAASYFIYDIYNEDLIITNKNGFAFNLYDNLSAVDFGYLNIDNNVLIGSFSLNTNTSAGSESDVTGVEFIFDDHNGNLVDNYGNGTLKWSFGKEDGSSNQKVSLSVNMVPAGYEAEVNGNSDAFSQKTSISGSGSATVPALNYPFYVWWSKSGFKQFNPRQALLVLDFLFMLSRFKKIYEAEICFGADIVGCVGIGRRFLFETTYGERVGAARRG